MPPSDTSTSLRQEYDRLRRRLIGLDLISQGSVQDRTDRQGGGAGYQWTRKVAAKTVTVAVPVGPPSTIEELEKQADKVICLQTPDYFQAIGQFYADFNQTEDEEVIELLKQNRQKNPNKPEGMVKA